MCDIVGGRRSERSSGNVVSVIRKESLFSLAGGNVRSMKGPEMILVIEEAVKV